MSNKSSNLTCTRRLIREVSSSIRDEFVRFFVTFTHKKAHKKFTNFISPSLKVSDHQNFTPFLVTQSDFFDGVWTNFTKYSHVFATSEVHVSEL